MQSRDNDSFMIKMVILHKSKTIFSRLMPYFHILVQLLIEIVNNGNILTNRTNERYYLVPERTWEYKIIIITIMNTYVKKKIVN